MYFSKRPSKRGDIKEQTMKQISAVMLGAAAVLIAANALAQTNYPEKPIRIIVGFPPGGSADTLSRLVSQKLTVAFAQPIVIENIPGAGGNIATERAARAAPDGYTLGYLGQGQLVINPNLYKLPFDTVKDFAPISQVDLAPNILVVNNTVPADSVKALVALAKAQPGTLTFASTGGGNANHMAAVLFKSVAGIDIRHIPYKGAPAAIPDLVGGRVTMLFGTTPITLPMVRDGKLRALAVTSSSRAPTLPALPTIAESGYPGFEYTSWSGLFAPAKTPAAIVQKLYLETAKALALPDLRAKFVDLGTQAVGNSPEEFAALIKLQIPKYAKLIKEAGIKAE
jgi:tripartite-type tricarboxylate transporter receptor subunit TctC